MQYICKILNLLTYSDVAINANNKYLFSGFIFTISGYAAK